MKKIIAALILVIGCVAPIQASAQCVTVHFNRVDFTNTPGDENGEYEEIQFYMRIIHSQAGVQYLQTPTTSIEEGRGGTIAINKTLQLCGASLLDDPCIEIRTEGLELDTTSEDDHIPLGSQTYCHPVVGPNPIAVSQGKWSYQLYLTLTWWD